METIDRAKWAINSTLAMADREVAWIYLGHLNRKNLNI